MAKYEVAIGVTGTFSDNYVTFVEAYDEDSAEIKGNKMFYQEYRLSADEYEVNNVEISVSKM